MFELLWPCGDAEFHGERIVEMHMQRLGGKEQLLAQVYSAIATRRDDTVELALRAYGAPEPRSRPGIFTVNVSSIYCTAVHCTALHCTALHCTFHYVASGLLRASVSPDWG